MNRSLFLTILTVSVLLPISGYVYAEESALLRPFLFKISRGGHSSYVIGTQHVAFNAKAIPESVVRTIQSSKFFASEATNMSDNYLWGWVGATFYPRGPVDLKKEMGTANWSRLKKFLPHYQESEFRYWPPYLAFAKAVEGAISSRSLSSRELAVEVQIDPENSKKYESLLAKDNDNNFDTALENLARRAGVSIVDGVDLSAIRNDFARKMARFTVRELMRSLVVLDRLHASGKIKPESGALLPVAFAAGDADLLLKSVSGIVSWHVLSETDLPEFVRLERESQNRHVEWLTQISSWHDQGQLFLAVGALHLFYGEQNLLALLKREGFEITRVNLTEMEDARALNLCENLLN